MTGSGSMKAVDDISAVKIENH